MFSSKGFFALFINNNVVNKPDLALSHLFGGAKTWGKLFRQLTTFAIFTAILSPNSYAAPGSPILERLQEGGLILYMRHAHANVGSDDTSDPDYWQSCEQQRRLSQYGQVQANTIGAFLKAHSIPVEKVLSSPLCRSLKTAELLGVGEVITDERLSYIKTWEAMGKPASELLPAFQKLLATKPKKGSNIILVSHSQRGDYVAHPVLDLIKMGTIAVFQPNKKGKVELIATIDSQDWQYLGVTGIPSN